jgi:hypothetical protein
VTSFISYTGFLPGCSNTRVQRAGFDLHHAVLDVAATSYFAARVVTVRGRNLDRLALGLHSRALALIEQFDPNGTRRGAEDAPVIEEMETAAAH